MGRPRQTGPVIRGVLLSPAAAAEQADCGTQTVVDAIRRGDLPAYAVLRRNGSSPAWAIDPRDLDGWSPRPRGFEAREEEV